LLFVWSSLVVVRVLLDATAVPADRRGVGRYVDNLIPALARCGVDLRVACQSRDRDLYAHLSGADPLLAPRYAESAASRLVWEQAGLPRLISAVAPDVVHAPHYTHPIALRRPLVVTLHDATFFTDPRVHTVVKGPFFRAATKLALRRAGCCLVPSQASADELVRVAGADPARLQVAHHGVDLAVFAPPSDAALDAARVRLGVRPKQRYVAFLGTLEPRKNVPALIRGWIAACEGRPDAPALVLVGGPGWDDDLETAIAGVPSGLTLIRPGYLPIESLSGVLGGASVVAYPSLAEGFGLPVLEAMACGAPVLTTRTPALREIGADAIEYTEPDEAAIGAALARLLGDPARRAELSAAGRIRAAGFTWDACAQAHILAYERAIASLLGPAQRRSKLRRNDVA